jgi:carboxy-cis,cis-muconate cyclase
VDESGALIASFANISYSSAAGVHGTALSPSNDFIYSADDMGNAVWVHSYDSSTGDLEEVQYLPAAEGSNPRHLAVNPNGKWAYVVYEEANSIASYMRDPTTGELTFTNETHSLLPTGNNFTKNHLLVVQELRLTRCRIHQHLIVLGRRSTLFNSQ